MGEKPPHKLCLHIPTKLKQEERQTVLAQVTFATWPSPVIQSVAILRIRTIAACTVGSASDATNSKAQSCADVAAIRLAHPRGSGEWEHGAGRCVVLVDACAIRGAGARGAGTGCTNSGASSSGVILLADDAKCGVHTTVRGVDAHSVQ